MYRRNERFLLACEQDYKICKDVKQYEPCEYQHTSNKQTCCDSCDFDICKQKNIPKTITDVLCNLINEQIQITTPFGIVTGT